MGSEYVTTLRYHNLAEDYSATKQMVELTQDTSFRLLGSCVSSLLYSMKGGNNMNINDILDSGVDIHDVDPEEVIRLIVSK